ncbi:4Fe-4S dicluster domain-containing protein [Candidatus Woesearchaeota archaeon]|nr:4Fe-4S dicluster domain-containing protein [Candidatus Woesearchaeota archaeon]
MQIFRQDKKDLAKFLDKLRQSYELIAPLKKDLVRFESIKNSEDISNIHLEKNSYFPIKEYFFKKQEVLFQFDGDKITVPRFNTTEKVFFGIRKCDLNAIHHQDMVFLEQADDPYYAAARKGTYLLGYHCNEAPSEYCFCGSLDLIDFFDLMFYDRKDYFLVEVGSEKGRALVEKYKEYFTKTDKQITSQDKVIKNADRLEKLDISKLYDNKDWKKGVGLCLSCTACTSLCPTCYCFEIKDEPSIKGPKKAERKRSWSSCQLPEFTRVAHDHVFRKEREQRFKHRIYHQLDYFKQRNGVNLCVGCGRCIEGCPTRIDFVKIINEMKE